MMEQEESRCRTSVLIAIGTRLKTSLGGSHQGTEREAMQVVVRSVWRTVQLGDPNTILVIQDGMRASEAKVFRARAPPQGTCENLINALELLTNQQKDGEQSS